MENDYREKYNDLLVFMKKHLDQAKQFVKTDNPICAETEIDFMMNHCQFKLLEELTLESQEMGLYDIPPAQKTYNCKIRIMKDKGT